MRGVSVGEHPRMGEGEPGVKKIRAIQVIWGDGKITHVAKHSDGSWKAEGIQQWGPKGLLEHLALWIENSYREDE